MKKALVILLSLFVVGGVFAQTHSWGGWFEGGVAMINKGVDDDATFAVIAPQAGAGGARALLSYTFTNADGNAGAFVMFRSNINAGAAVDFNLRQAYGWVNFVDGMVEVRGGRIHNDPIANPDFNGFHFWGGRTGLVTYIRPIDGLTIGLGGYSQVNVANAASWEAGGLNIYGGFAFAMPGLLRFNAALQATGKEAPAGNPVGINAAAGLSVSAIEMVPIAIGTRFMRLDEFGDAGRVDITGNIGFNLMPGLGLGILGGFSMNNAIDDSDPFFGFGAFVSYAVGNIVPRLDAYFIGGGQLDYTYGMAGAGWAFMDYPLMTYNADQSYFSIRPSVQIRATSTAVFELGAMINMELGDVGAAGGSKDDTMSFGIFTSIRTSF